MEKGDVRVSIYENPDRCVVRFRKNAIKMFNGPYVRLEGKAGKLYFYTGTPTRGVLVDEKNGIQIGRKRYVEDMKRYEGLHTMLFDEGLRVYYIDTDAKKSEAAEQTDEKAEPPIPEDGPEKKPVRKRRTIKEEVAAAIEAAVEESNRTYTLDDVREKLTETMVGCIDGDDLAGAKAIIKAMRGFGVAI